MRTTLKAGKLFLSLFLVLPLLPTLDIAKTNFIELRDYMNGDTLFWADGERVGRSDDQTNPI